MKTEPGNSYIIYSLLLYFTSMYLNLKALEHNWDRLPSDSFQVHFKSFIGNMILYTLEKLNRQMLHCSPDRVTFRRIFSVHRETTYMIGFSDVESTYISKSTFQSIQVYFFSVLIWLLTRTFSSAFIQTYRWRMYTHFFVHLL